MVESDVLRVKRIIQTYLLLWWVASPASGQPRVLELLATLPGSVAVVHADGTLAGLANGNELTVLDLSDPSAPAKRGTLTLSDRIWDLVVDGELAYIANGFAGFVVVDLADPDAPVVRGAYEVVSQGQTVSVSMAGNLVLTTNNQTGLNVFDVSNAADPQLLSSWLTGGYSRDVVGMGTFGLVADQPDGLHVIDISDPSDPLEASIHFAEDETTQLVAVAGATAYIVDGGSARVEIIDLGDPQAPARAGTYQAPGRVASVAAAGTALYLALGRDGLVSVDMTDPAAPRVAASSDTPGTARVVALVDDLVLVGTGDALLVLRARP